MKKKSMAEKRWTLVNHLIDVGWSAPTRETILKIITSMPRNTPGEIKEAKAEEILTLIADCRTEEEALKKVEQLKK